MDTYVAWKRRFDQFTIRLFRITDYEPEEPGELFYRLNQPTGLTAAEQRNAFFGPVRQQVKELVTLLKKSGISKDYVGFSNSRMAYDDVIARLCTSLEAHSIREKVTSTLLAQWYRSSKGFSSTTVAHCSRAIRIFAKARLHTTKSIRLNKATFFSWLWFIADISRNVNEADAARMIGLYLVDFETARLAIAKGEDVGPRQFTSDYVLPPPFIRRLLKAYADRSTARVADVYSVVTRDITLWLMFSFAAGHALSSKTRVTRKLTLLESALIRVDNISRIRDPEVLISELLEEGWGSFE